MTAVEEQAHALPDAVTLSTHQLRGVRCVYCDTLLRTGALHDFGERTREVHGHRVRWFPRCCLPCFTRPKGKR